MNTYYFTTLVAQPGLNEFTILVAALQKIYTKVGIFMSSGVSREAIHPCKLYRVGAPLDSPPEFTGQITLPAPASGSKNLPTEVAICVTMHADFQPGVIRQSWRGRVYLGPLNTDTMDTPPGPGRPYAVIMSQWAAAFVEFDVACHANADWQWVIFSKKLNRVYPVARLSIDNAFDTQRRRGLAPTAQLVDNGAMSGKGVPAGPA